MIKLSRDTSHKIMQKYLLILLFVQIYYNKMKMEEPILMKIKLYLEPSRITDCPCKIHTIIRHILTQKEVV